MNRNGMRGLCVALALFCIAGCGDKQANTVPKQAPKVIATEVPAGQEMTLFPMVVGNQWIYNVESALQTPQGSKSATQEATFRISEVKPFHDGKTCTLEVIAAGKVTEKSSWSIDSKGIYQNTAGTPPVPYNPPQPVMTFPPKKGSKFTWSGVGKRNVGANGPIKANSTILGPQEVDTDMGRMSAIAVETRATWSDKNVEYQMASTVWWAPGVGIVRYLQVVGSKDGTSSVLLRLKSHSLKSQ